MTKRGSASTITLMTWNMEHGADRWTNLPRFTTSDGPAGICLQETSNVAMARGMRRVPSRSQTYVGPYRIGTAGRGLLTHRAIWRFGSTGQNSVGVLVANPATGAVVVVDGGLSIRNA